MFITPDFWDLEDEDRTMVKPSSLGRGWFVITTGGGITIPLHGDEIVELYRYAMEVADARWEREDAD